jgi:hypothetical protein
MVSAVVCGCVRDLPLPRFFTANGRTYPQRHFTQTRDCAYPYVFVVMPHAASTLGGKTPAAKPEFGSATARAVLLIAKSDIRPICPSKPRKKNRLAAQVAMPLVPRLAEMK